MIDWLAVKRAADISENDASFWNKDPNFQQKYNTYHTAFMKTPPDLRAENNIQPLNENYDRMVFTPKAFTPSFPTKPHRESRSPEQLQGKPVTPGVMNAVKPITRGNAVKLDNTGGIGLNVDKSKINRALFGNDQNADYEQKRALDNRWRRMYQSSRWYHRPVLDFYRRLGYIPPIYMGGRTVTYPARPNKTIKMSLMPGKGRSWANPFNNNMFIGADYNETDRNVLRAVDHELAHIETPTWKNAFTKSDSKNFDYSVADDVTGGDQGELDFFRKGVGAYELDPSELTRMIYLQKAAFSRLGLPQIRDFDEWLDYMEKNQGWADNRSGKPVEDAELANPYQETSLDNVTHKVFGTGEYSDGGNFLSSYNSFSLPLIFTIKSLRDKMDPSSIYSEEEKAWARRQYEQIKRAVQDALDLS